jgi:hypothetical protein
MGKQNKLHWNTIHLRRKILSHAPAYMNLEDIILSKVSQSEKDDSCIILSI